MEYAVHIVRVDGQAITVPLGSRADAADLIIETVTLHETEDEDNGATIVFVDEDELHVVLTINEYATSILIAAPVERQLVDILRAREYLEDAVIDNLISASVDNIATVH